MFSMQIVMRLRLKVERKLQCCLGTDVTVRGGGGVKREEGQKRCEIERYFYIGGLKGYISWCSYGQRHREYGWKNIIWITLKMKCDTRPNLQKSAAWRWKSTCKSGGHKKQLLARGVSSWLCNMPQNVLLAYWNSWNSMLAGSGDYVRLQPVCQWNENKSSQKFGVGKMKRRSKYHSCVGSVSSLLMVLGSALPGRNFMVLVQCHQRSGHLIRWTSDL